LPDISLFGTLNTGLLGIYASKLAMNVVAHNIANANTPGFFKAKTGTTYHAPHSYKFAHPTFNSFADRKRVYMFVISKG